MIQYNERLEGLDIFKYVKCCSGNAGEIYIVNGKPANVYSTVKIRKIGNILVLPWTYLYLACSIGDP